MLRLYFWLRFRVCITHNSNDWWCCASSVGLRLRVCIVLNPKSVWPLKQNDNRLARKVFSARWLVVDAPSYNLLIRQLINLWCRKLVNKPTCKRDNQSTRQPLFCPLFSINFNIMSAVFGHHSSARPQKSNSREGLFWCQKGVVVNASKTNMRCIKLQFVPCWGLFFAKHSAFCC